MALSQKIKLLSIIICVATSYGCQLAQSNTASQPLAKGDTCQDMPQGTLDAKDVKAIDISVQAVNESGTIRAGQNLGYAFNGKTGNKLSWRTADNLCIWVFAPSSKLLKGGDLTETGKHTVQVSIPKGTTTFTLEMGLNALQASAPPPVSPTFTPPLQNNTSPPVVAATSGITQDQATSLVQNWLNSKGRIFGPPFDRQLARQLTTGVLYYDVAEKPNGSIDWLKSNNSYYTFALSRVDRVWEFNNAGSNPNIKVTITEDRTLYGANGGIDYSKSGRKTANYTYYFSQENNGWKINDYKNE